MGRCFGSSTTCLVGRINICALAHEFLHRRRVPLPSPVAQPFLCDDGLGELVLDGAHGHAGDARVARTLPPPLRRPLQSRHLLCTRRGRRTRGGRTGRSRSEQPHRETTARVKATSLVWEACVPKEEGPKVLSMLGSEPTRSCLYPDAGIPLALPHFGTVPK